MIKRDAIDAMLMFYGDVLIEQNAGEYEKAICENMPRPKKLDRRVEKMIRRDRREREYGTYIRYCKKAVFAVAIFCTFLFSCMMSVEAVRDTVWEVVVDFYEEYMSINYVVEAEVPTEIIAKRKPKTGHDEWKEQIVLDSKNAYSINYYYPGRKRVFRYSQYVITVNDIWIDNENSEVNDILIHNYRGIIVYRREKDDYIINWCDSEYMYLVEVLNNSVTKEELIEIAESIYE